MMEQGLEPWGSESTTHPSNHRTGPSAFPASQKEGWETVAKAGGFSLPGALGQPHVDQIPWGALLPPSPLITPPILQLESSF